MKANELDYTLPGTKVMINGNLYMVTNLEGTVVDLKYGRLTPWAKIILFDHEVTVVESTIAVVSIKEPAQ